MRITQSHVSSAASAKVQMGSDLLRHREVWQPGLNMLNSEGAEGTMADGVALVIFFFLFFTLYKCL